MVTNGLAAAGSARFWQGRSVLVTGATGLVGSWLVDALLERQAEVVALVRDPNTQSEFFRSRMYDRCNVVTGAVEEFASIERAINEFEVDTVFHLAAQPIVQVADRFPLQTFESNIRGTYMLLEACRVHERLVRRIVVASSDKAYGTAQELPYREDTQLIGRRPYEVSKSCADLLSQSYFHSYRLPIAIARCGNIYGGGDLNWSRLVPGTIKSCLQKMVPVLRSDGTSKRDYIYVKDAVQSYLVLAEKLESGGSSSIVGEAFNFSCEKPLTSSDVVKSIQKLTQTEQLGMQVLNQAQSEIHSQYLDSSKAKNQLDWQARYTFEEGIQETLAWYSSYLSK